MPGAELYLVVLLYFERVEIFEPSVSTLDEVKEENSCFATFLCIEIFKTCFSVRTEVWPKAGSSLRPFQWETIWAAHLLLARKKRPIFQNSSTTGDI